MGHALTPHGHNYQAAALDAALATERGIWAVKVSLIVLLVGLAIGVAILFIVWDTARDIAYRVMDAVEPSIPALITKTA